MNNVTIYTYASTKVNRLGG